MAYVVKNTRNQIVATVNDGAVDNSTSLSLIGRNYVGYGLALNTNFMYLLENFTGNTAPSTPVTGQLWYDGNTNDLKIYNGAGFVQAIKQVANLAASGNLDVTGNANIGNANITGTVRAATANITGSANIGSTLDVVGNITAGNVTGTLLGGTLITASQPNITSVGTLTSLAVTNGITATTGNITTVNSGLMQNGNSNVTIAANSAVSIAANGAVRMTVAANGNVGVGTASPGVKLDVTGSARASQSITIGNGGGTYQAGSIYSDSNWGMLFRAAQATPASGQFRWSNSADAEYMRIDSSGNVGIGTASPGYTLDVQATTGSISATSTTGTNYAKVQVNNTGGSYQFGIDNSAGTNFGSGVGYARVIWNDSASAPTILYTNSSERIRIKSDGNVGIGNAAPTHTLSVTGTMNISGNANVGNLGATTVVATTGNITTINSGLMQNGNSNVTITANSNVTIAITAANSYTFATSSFAPSSNATVQLGLTGSRWSNVWGISSSAQYADLAEKYRADADYEPGTVLEIGGEHEITVCNTPRSDKVFGCVSTDPAYLMNDIEKEGIWLPVVLTGRAPIRVAGTVNKGDRLVSAGNGAAMAAGTFGSSYQTEIGRALETKTTEEIATIEAYISTR